MAMKWRQVSSRGRKSYVEGYRSVQAYFSWTLWLDCFFTRYIVRIVEESVLCLTVSAIHA
jgi:hypothetical protein